MPDVDRGILVVAWFWLVMFAFIFLRWINPLVGFGLIGALTGVIFVIAAWWGKD